MEGGREETEAPQPAPSPPRPLDQEPQHQAAVASPVPSPEAALVLVAAAVEEQVLQGAMKILESEEEEASPEVRAESVSARQPPADPTVVSSGAADGDPGAAQAQKVPAGPQEVPALQAEGRQLVGSVQPGAAPGAQPQPAPAVEKEEATPPASGPEEAPRASTPPREGAPGPPPDGSEAAEGGLASLPPGGLPLPAPAKKAAAGTTAGMEGEGPQQSGGPETPGAPPGASPDASELPLQEKEEGKAEARQEGVAPRESGDGQQTHTQETPQKQEQDPARAELADS